MHRNTVYRSLRAATTTTGIQRCLAGIRTPTRYHDILTLCHDTASHPEWLFMTEHPLYTEPVQP